MCEGNRNSMAKEALKMLCRSHGWCYGAFWGFDQRNSLILTLQDAYHEEQMGAVIDEMLLQVHILGGGIIGQAAFTKKHKWMFSDAYHERQIPVGSSNNSNLFMDDGEFERQFSTGIKTIAVISVEPLGVLQFGSTNKLPERISFVDQARKLFQGLEAKAGIFESTNELCGLGGTSTSLISENLHFGNPNVVLSTTNNESFMNESCLFEDLMIQSVTCDSDNQIMTSVSEKQFDSCSNSQFDTPLDQPMFQSTGFFTGSHGFDDLPLDMSIQDFSSVLFTGRPNHFEYGADAIQSFHDSSAFGSLGGFGVFPNGAVSTINDNILDSTGIISASANLNEQQKPSFNVDIDASVSVQSSITNAFNTIEKANSRDLAGVKHGVSSNRLFSKLGLDELLGGGFNASCSYSGSVSDDQMSGTNKRRRIGSSSGCDWGFSKSEAVTKSDKTSCNTVLPAKGNQKTSKPTTKKKAKPGTRPIPKDRQLIYERLSELRELIPNGEKMSIDRLLHRTVKHLLFLQGVTKHAEGLKRTEDLKNAKNRLEKSKTNGNGVTWACEIGDQTMICPLIVEDLGTPGQMLIEILCQEQGFFLEIVDIVRGFGLNILKGMMESRETKMWAHFVVEAEGNRLVTRHEIFSSLVQLLQLTSTSEVGLNNHLHDITGGRTGLLNDCLNSAVHISRSLPETVRCVQ